MRVLPINHINNNTSLKDQRVNFGHGDNTKNSYTTGQKILITATSTIGVLGSLAILAKREGYSLNLSKMFKNIKKSYLATKDYEAKEVIAMGVGSCLGGLAGGYIVDKDPVNRRAKRRESLMQIGNVSVPILLVHFIVGRKLRNKSEMVKALASLGCVGVGVPLSNVIMNTINSYIFDKGVNKNRRMKVTDFSAHLDDVVVAANYISKADWVRAIGRLVPAALVIPGLEIGHKTAN